MFFKTVALSTALRPDLFPDETLLFVQDTVGLYEGKLKLPKYQNGHAYLTSHRICYVDNTEPRLNSIAIELREIERYEFYAGFLKSSPKITFYPRHSKRSSTESRSISSFSSSQCSVNAPSHQATALPQPELESQRRGSPSTFARTRSMKTTWVCPICSLSNPIPSNFDPTIANAYTPLPPCLACGIKPRLSHLLKAVISDAIALEVAISTNPEQSLLNSHLQANINSSEDHNGPSCLGAMGSMQDSSNQCFRCTFQNHPSLRICEMCGASLIFGDTSDVIEARNFVARSGPSFQSIGTFLDHTPEYIKISFRAGGDKIFYERLRGAMVQRKWLLQNAPPIPQPTYINGSYSSETSKIHITASGHILDSRSAAVGIARLERRGLDMRKTNEAVIGNAFEDLEALMASAKEIVALAESFADSSIDDDVEADTVLKESAMALGMVTTRAMLGSTSGSESLYISELSRTLAEYLTDDRRNILKREGGIIGLIDLWAIFNRASNGIELIYPIEFEKAARMWEKLALPVRLRQLRNGLLVAQSHDWTDEKSIDRLLGWLQSRRVDTVHDKCLASQFGQGVTAQETAAAFGWSVGIASEELELAEEKGALCREESVEGTRFWQNWLNENCASADRK